MPLCLGWHELGFFIACNQGNHGIYNNFIWTIKKVSIKVDSNVTGGGGIEEIQK